MTAIPDEVAITLANVFRQAYADYVRTIIEPGESLPYSQHLKATEAGVRAVILARDGRVNV